jgi:endo-1,4-beta-xylanase
MKRREFIRRSLQWGSLAALPAVFADRAAASPANSLKAMGGPCGLKVGVQSIKAQLQNPAFAQTAIANFQMLTPGNELKWARLRPGPDSYNFGDADWMVDFAQQNRMLVHGHNLCWNAEGTNPAWFASTLTKENARQYLTQHITTVMGRYRGRIDSWDVVNEPIVPWSKRDDGLYPGIWLNLLGPEYIDIAFHAAAAADPKALRVLNTYYVEQGTADHEKGRRDNLRFLQQCKRRGVPIQALGIESHLDASQPPGGRALRQFVDEVKALGLQVLITELDVNDTQVTGNYQDRDAAVARCYSDYLLEVVPPGHVDRVIFWTATDKGNWLNSVRASKFQRPDGGPHRPGLLDDNLRPKPAYTAVGDAITRVCADGPGQLHAYTSQPVIRSR